MPASAFQICGLQIQGLERSEVFVSEAREFLQKLVQRLLSALPRLCKTVVGVEWPCFAVLEYDARPRHPVGSLADDQVAHDVEGVPCVGSLVAANPDIGKPAQQHVEACGSTSENCEGLGQVEFRQGCHVHVDA